jgi:hypothetical protein
MPLTAALLQYCRVRSVGDKRTLASADCSLQAMCPIARRGTVPSTAWQKRLADRGYFDVGCCSGGRGVSVLIVSCHGVGLLGEERGMVESKAIRGSMGVVNCIRTGRSCVAAFGVSIWVHPTLPYDGIISDNHLCHVRIIEKKLNNVRRNL